MQAESHGLARHVRAQGQTVDVHVFHSQGRQPVRPVGQFGQQCRRVEGGSGFGLRSFGQVGQARQRGMIDTDRAYYELAFAQGRPAHVQLSLVHDQPGPVRVRDDQALKTQARGQGTGQSVDVRGQARGG